jgi:hypothetical protein
MDWRDYAKTVVALVVAAAGALVTALGPGDMSLSDLSTKSWIEAAIAVVGSAAAVHLVDNFAGVAGSVAKAVSAALTAGLGALLLAMADESAGGAHITQSEWLGVFLTAVLATGFVYQTTESNSPQRLRGSLPG